MSAYFTNCLSGQWRHDDYDVICDGAVVGRIMHMPTGGEAMEVVARLRLSSRSHPHFWLRGDARGGNGGVRKVMARRLKDRTVP